jgi:hypothetical protein
VLDNVKEITFVDYTKQMQKDRASHHFDVATTEGSKNDTRKVNSLQN